MSRNQFKPGWAELLKIPYTETGIVKPPKQVEDLSVEITCLHRSPRWHMKDEGHTYLFQKRSLLMRSLVEALARFEVEVKMAVWAKHIFLKNSCHTSLYLLDFFLDMDPHFFLSSSCKITRLYAHSSQREVLVQLDRHSKCLNHQNQRLCNFFLMGVNLVLQTYGVLSYFFFFFLFFTLFL